MNQSTIKYKRLYLLFKLISVLIIVAPIGYYVLNTLIFAEITTVDRFIVSATTISCIILAILNLVLQVFKHSKFWLIMIGLALVLPDITTFIIVFGCANIVNEIVIEPLEKHYKSKYTINKEIDKR